MDAVSTATLPTLARYERHLAATARWLLRSLRHGQGGSCAYWCVAGGWSRPYPETTGYLIPTLLRLHAFEPDLGAESAAVRAGEWLLAIQRADGAWNGGLHPPRGASQGSVFNTGQILKGMAALQRLTREPRWLLAAERGARWLRNALQPDGLWPAGDYRAGPTPTYYTHVAWPMLEVWAVNGDERLREAARGVLDQLLLRRRADGSFEAWGFEPGRPASTHTIAYTLRGLLESARLLNGWEHYGEPALAALERLRCQAELRGGALPGAFNAGFSPATTSVCLTGNAQTALNLLLLDRREPDLRLVNAAAKLVDRVCDAQHLAGVLPGLRGAVPGSSPPWGPYMAWRHPNWAAKYLCDALLALRARLRLEIEAL